MAEYIIEDNGWIENGGYIRPAPSGWLPPKPIVRCRDCKHYDDYLGTCLRPSHNFAAEPDGFCKWGERR